MPEVNDNSIKSIIEKLNTLKCFLKNEMLRRIGIANKLPVEEIVAI